MKVISWIILCICTILFFCFAMQNQEIVHLQLFPGNVQTGPLVLFLLGFFILGAIAGVLAMTPSVFRHRRNVSKTKKMLVAIQKEQEAQRLAQSQAPHPDSVKNI